MAAKGLDSHSRPPILPLGSERDLRLECCRWSIAAERLTYRGRASASMVGAGHGRATHSAPKGVYTFRALALRP